MVKDTQLCIYFGLKGINLAEIQNRRPVADYFVPYDAVIESGVEISNVPENVKLTAGLQKALRDNKIETQEAFVSLPTKDFIVRSFVIPAVPREEVSSIVEFEVRKYIPFKLEDLLSDYQLFPETEGRLRRFRVIFIGARRDIFEKYVYVLEQAGLKVRCMEPHTISLIRLLLLKKIISFNQIPIIVETNLGEGTIIIEDRGVPYLIRDFKLSPSSNNFASESDYNFTQLLSEIRISLEYYRRHNPKGNLGRLLLFSNGEMKKCTENLGKELGIASAHYSHQDIVGIKEAVDYGLLFAYGAGLVTSVKMPLTINLAKKRFKQEAVAAKEMVERTASPQVILRSVAMGLILIALTASFNLIKISGLNSDLKRLKMVDSSLGALSDVEIKKMISIFEQKNYSIQEAISEVGVNPIISAIPLLLPDGVWLTALSFRVESPSARSVIFRGIAYLGDASTELDRINKFILNLERSPEISKVFKTVSLVNATANQGAAEEGGTSFEIVCR